MTCEQCGSTFEPRRRRKDGRFCRAQCRARWHQARRAAALRELAILLANAARVVAELRKGEEIE
jgi:hypothetical protein